MKSFELVEKYCDDVCNQIRWKKVKPFVSLELENHICDQRDAYMLQGDNEMLATEKAVAQMGDPIFVGEELDKTHRPKEQWLMMGFIFIFMLIGVGVNLLVETNMNYSIIFSYVVASILVIVCQYIDFTILRKNPLGIYFATIAISFILIMWGSYVNGKNVFLADIFVVYPIAFMLIVYSMKSKGYRGVLQCGLYNIPIVIILFFELPLYYLLFHIIVSLIVLCFAINTGWFGVNKKNALMLVLIPTVIGFLTVCYGFIYDGGFRSERLKAFINPYKDIDGAGYFNYTIRTLMKEVGVFPKELGEIADLFYIGEVFPLFLFIYKFGLICLFFIIFFIMLFSILGIRKGLKEKSMLGKLICVTVISIFIVQSGTYIISSIGYGLSTSNINNFMFSSGLALYTNSILLGFMLSVFRIGGGIKISE